MKSALPLALLVSATSLNAQILPSLDPGNPRLQAVQWVEGQDVMLTAMPFSGLTVMLEPGEKISRVVVDDETSLDVRVSPEGDSLLLLPRRALTASRLFVTTDRRTYPLTLRTDSGLTAAYLVRFQYVEAFPAPDRDTRSPAPGPIWSYRLRGDTTVQPIELRDDGRRTFITFGHGQALSAVFAIGPTGEEELVNGYMRAGVYVIDRIYSELVFRIDRDRATARRNSEPDPAQ